jgi:hypothetical protein
VTDDTPEIAPWQAPPRPPRPEPPRGTTPAPGMLWRTAASGDAGAGAYQELPRLLVLVLDGGDEVGDVVSVALIDADVEWAIEDDLLLAADESTDGSPLRVRLGLRASLATAQLDEPVAELTPAGLRIVRAAEAGTLTDDRFGAMVVADTDARLARDAELRATLELLGGEARPEGAQAAAPTLVERARGVWSSGTTSAAALGGQIAGWWAEHGAPAVTLTPVAVRGPGPQRIQLHGLAGEKARLLMVGGELMLRLDGLRPELDGQRIVVLLPRALHTVEVAWRLAPGLGRSDGPVRDGAVGVDFGPATEDLSGVLGRLDDPVEIRAEDAG